MVASVNGYCLGALAASEHPPVGFARTRLRSRPVAPFPGTRPSHAAWPKHKAQTDADEKSHVSYYQELNEQRSGIIRVLVCDIDSVRDQIGQRSEQAAKTAGVRSPKQRIPFCRELRE